MTNGIKVKILSRSPHEKYIYGYITRRLNVSTYEIYIEETGEILILDRTEFIEIED